MENSNHSLHSMFMIYVFHFKILWEKNHW